MTAPTDLLATVGRTVGADSVAQLTAPSGRRVSWEQAFGAEAAAETLLAHAKAVGVPSDVASVLVAEQVVAPLARLQAWTLTLDGRCLDLAPEELGLFIGGDGRVLRAVDVSAARVVDAGDSGAVAILDVLIEALVARCTEAGSRVPARVAASAALFAWYAALREVSSQLGGRTPADVLESQWKSRWTFGSLTRPIEVSSSRTYLARAACCLEYRGDDPDERRYCTSCPMVDPDHARERLRAPSPLPGGRRPFTHDALRKRAGVSRVAQATRPELNE